MDRKHIITNIQHNIIANFHLGKLTQANIFEQINTS